ncbi:MAG: hypothetical protein K0B07_04345 [DPANN group archaeon]|nr:hypothetical protein [DPANN group archaeon]
MPEKYNFWKPLPKQIIPNLITELRPAFDKMKISDNDINDILIYKNSKRDEKSDDNVHQFKHYGRLNKHDKNYNWLYTNNYDLVFLIKDKDETPQYIIKYAQTKQECNIIEQLKDSSFMPKLKCCINSGNEHIISEEYIPYMPAYHNNFRFLKRHQTIYAKIVADIFSEMHQKSVIYNEEIPHHLMIDTVTKHAKLLDFGNAYFVTNDGSYEGEIIRIVAHMQKHDILKKNIERFLNNYRHNIEYNGDDSSKYLYSDNNHIIKSARSLLKNKPRRLRL